MKLVSGYEADEDSLKEVKLDFPDGSLRLSRHKTVT